MNTIDEVSEYISSKQYYDKSFCFSTVVAQLINSLNPDEEIVFACASSVLVTISKASPVHSCIVRNDVKKYGDITKTYQNCVLAITKGNHFYKEGHLIISNHVQSPDKEKFGKFAMPLGWFRKMGKTSIRSKRSDDTAFIDVYFGFGIRVGFVVPPEKLDEMYADICQTLGKYAKREPETDKIELAFAKELWEETRDYMIL